MLAKNQKRKPSSHQHCDKRPFVLIFAISLFYCFAFTQLLMASDGNQEKNFLWKVTAKQGHLYLLGSIHAAQEDMYPLSEEIMQAFRESSVLVLEANLESSSGQNAHAEIVNKAMMKDKTLSEILPSDLSELLADRCSETGISYDAMQNYRPWFVATQYTMAKLQQIGFDSTSGIDTYFSKQASQAGKEILELEGVEKQIEIMSSFTSEEEIAFVRMTLRNSDQIEAMMQELKRAWLEGDVDYLKKELLEKPLQEDPSLEGMYEKLFFVRNREMTEKIIPMIQSGTTHFVVVGAGHLLGARGILSLLQESGFQPEQV